MLWKILTRKSSCMALTSPKRLRRLRLWQKSIKNLSHLPVKQIKQSPLNLKSPFVKFNATNWLQASGSIQKSQHRLIQTKSAELPKGQERDSVHVEVSDGRPGGKEI